MDEFIKKRKEKVFPVEQPSRKFYFGSYFIFYLIHSVASRGYIVTPCQRERARRSHLPLAAGKYVPRCKVDGTYDEVQCDVVVGQCWCVDREGKEIKGTRNEGVIRCPSKGMTAIRCFIRVT